MLNDPLMMLIASQDPMAALNYLAQQNPEYRTILPLIQGKNAAQLRETTINVAKQKGIDLNQLANQIRSMIPKK